MMTTETDDLRIVPMCEVARLLGKTPKTLRALEADPNICFPKKIIINGRKFFRIMEIRNWLSDMQIQSENAELAFPVKKVSAAE